MCKSTSILLTGHKKLIKSTLLSALLLAYLSVSAQAHIYTGDFNMSTKISTIRSNQAVTNILLPEKESGKFHRLANADALANIKDNQKEAVLTAETALENIVQSNKNSGSASLSSPNLYVLLSAEFAYERGQVDDALQTYKQQSFNKNATAVFERALRLSLKYEDIEASLDFAHQWQKQNPNHIPAWFYVAHLALRAHQYELAGDTLSRILEFDPKADFSQILKGIYPTNENEQHKLLQTLQQLNSEQNATLSVLKAGLFLQFNEPKLALTHIDRALVLEPDNIPVITLKADILSQLNESAELFKLLQDARKKWKKSHTNNDLIDRLFVSASEVLNNANTDGYQAEVDLVETDVDERAQELYLYEIRYRLQKQEQDADSVRKAWMLLLEAHKQFSDNPEITLLASLVSLDIEEYNIGNQLLVTLLERPAYSSQAYFYLATSAERQQNYRRAKQYYALVEDSDLVLEARRKVVAYELSEGNVTAAIDILKGLRQRYPQYASDSYILQADILQQEGKTIFAQNLLMQAKENDPDDLRLQFAYVKLLDDLEAYQQKYETLTKLRQIDPDNLAYQLAFAHLLLSKTETKQQAVELAQSIVDIPYYDKRFDSTQHLEGLNLLATAALYDKQYQQVLRYLQTPYQLSPNLDSGLLLLKAYQAMGDNNNASRLQQDIQSRFSYPML